MVMLKTVLLLFMILTVSRSEDSAAPQKENQAPASDSAAPQNEDQALSSEKSLPKRYVYCGYGWRAFGSRCYKFFRNYRTWARAERFCQRRNGHLASVHSYAKQRFLLSMVPYGVRTWIGGHDGENEGNWLWIDGTRFQFTRWMSGEPNNVRRREHCLELNLPGTRRWNDENCYRRFSFICSRPRFY